MQGIAHHSNTKGGFCPTRNPNFEAIHQKLSWHTREQKLSRSRAQHPDATFNVELPHCSLEHCLRHTITPLPLHQSILSSNNTPHLRDTPATPNTYEAHLRHAPTRRTHKTRDTPTRHTRKTQHARRPQGTLRPKHPRSAESLLTWSAQCPALRPTARA